MTKIEWTDATWNPVTGCTKVSEGCRNCYAQKFAERFRGVKGHYFENGFDITLRPDKLDQPLRWKRPRRIFVNSMSDLFHEQVPFEFIRAVWARMAGAPQHTFQVLTKRPARALEFFEWMRSQDWGIEETLPNVWLGVSVENQRAADERIPLLLQTPAAVRFLSCEPLLGPVKLRSYWKDFEYGEQCDYDWLYSPDGEPTIDWVIVGGESGPNARPMHPDWVRSIRDQCQEAGVAFFFKQWGEWVPKDSGLSAKNMIHFHTSGKLYDPKKPEEWYAKGFETVYKVGKKKAGRMLDGCTWDETPKTTEIP